MKLTTLDLKKQQFGKTFRGLDPDEVRSFLDLVAQQWEEMQDEVRRAEERVVAAEHKLKHYERVEVALQEALESAREGARRAEVTAEQRAKLIVEEAELKALRVVNDAEQERHHLRQDLVKLTHRQNEVAARIDHGRLAGIDACDQIGVVREAGVVLEAFKDHGCLPCGSKSAVPRRDPQRCARSVGFGVRVRVAECTERGRFERRRLRLERAKPWRWATLPAPRLQAWWRSELVRRSRLPPALAPPRR